MNEGGTGRSDWGSVAGAVWMALVLALTLRALATAFFGR